MRAKTGAKPEGGRGESKKTESPKASQSGKEGSRGNWIIEGEAAAEKFLHGRWTARQRGLMPILK